MLKKSHYLGLLLAGLWLNGCKGDTKLQFMPDMADAPTVKAQESFINPPENSVATNAILYPADIAVAEREFKNPLPPNDMHLQKGKELFDTYCSVCHGPDGKGGGTLGDAYPVGVPDISRADLAERKDGFFFMKITTGQPMMPAYGHHTTPMERWQIILYLRTLQNKN